MTAAEVDAQWQEIKSRERRGRGQGQGRGSLAAALPALLLATKTIERDPTVVDDLPAPSDTSAGLGDRLLALVAEAHEAGIDPEQALRDAVRRAVAG
jgi:XTP/dITP diphosphohydrolase